MSYTVYLAKNVRMQALGSTFNDLASSKINCITIV